MKNFKIPFDSEIWNRMCYLIHPDKWYSLSEVTKIWKSTPGIAEKYLGMAIKAGVIITEGIGRMKKYRLNKEDYKVKDMIKQFEEMNIELPKVKSMGGTGP